MLHKNLYTALTQLSGAVENLSRSSSSFADTKEDILKKKKKTKKTRPKNQEVEEEMTVVQSRDVSPSI